MKQCNVCHQNCSWLVLLSTVIITTVILLQCGQYLIKLNPYTEIHQRVTNLEPRIEKSDRLKRFIIFNGNGVVKFVVGASFPVILPDKKRSLGAFYNFQIQYVPAPRPLYWWSFLNTTTFAARRERSIEILRQNDNSRTTIYEFIEYMIERECLLKTICDIARAPLTEVIDEEDAGDVQDDGHEYSIDPDYGQNIYHALINAIFTPNLPNVKQRYWDARVAGSKGANCDELFAKCSGMNDWLKRFTRFI